MKSFPLLQTSVVTILLVALLALAMPQRASAQASTIGGLVQCFAPSIKDLVKSIPYVGTFLSGGRNAVPVSDSPLEDKSCYDAILTGILKDVIKVMRDMVLQWIVTGRFSGPVFSTSFSLDLAKSAENASRIYLSQISGIDFCASVSAPSIRNFSLDAAFGLSCTLSPGARDTDIATFYQKLYRPAEYAKTHPYEDELTISNAQNNLAYTAAEIANQRDSAIARGLITKAAEYTTGQGFLDIKDEATGLVKTPAGTVSKLVAEQVITSPARQVDVANTLQQAIESIIKTAIQVLVNKGLAGVYGR